MDSLKVVSLTDDDVPKVLDLIEGHPEIFSKEETEIFREIVLTFLAEYPESKKDQRILVAKDQGLVVGCILFEKVPHSQGYFLLDYLIVKKELQNKGGGTGLIKQALQEIKVMGGDYAYLETSNERHNEKVRHFYQKLGFKKAGVLPDFFLPPQKGHNHTDDCIIYYIKL